MELQALSVVLGAILFLAIFTEGTVEYFFGSSAWAQPYLAWIALVVGVFVAIAYNIDIPGLAGLTTNFGIVSNIVSGVIIARGSNYVSDILSKVNRRTSDAV